MMEIFDSANFYAKSAFVIVANLMDEPPDELTNYTCDLIKNKQYPKYLNFPLGSLCADNTIYILIRGNLYFLCIISISFSSRSYKNMR